MKSFKQFQSNVQVYYSICEEVKFYNTILSHLLDEGYTNSIESAEKIIENMSEEWLDSILEGYKNLPRFKVLGKAIKRFIQTGEHGRKMGKAGRETTEGQIEAHKLDKRAGQFANIATTLLMHKPDESKSKEQHNRNVGAAKRRIQNLIRIDQNRRTLPVARMRAQTDRLFYKGHRDRSDNVDDMRMSRAQRYLRGYRNPEIGRFKPKDED